MTSEAQQIAISETLKMDQQRNLKQIMNLNSEQQAAIHKDTGQTVVIAGPGSGKTRTLVAKILKLIESGIPPGDIVAITFTNAAADEMSTRLPEGTKLRHCGTLHSWILKLLRVYHYIVGLPARLAVLDETAADELLKDVMHEHRFKGSVKSVRELLAKDAPHLLGATGPLWKEGVIAAGYLLRLREQGLLDYDSILMFGLQLMCHLTQKEIGRVLLVDEFQDTARADYEIYSYAPFSIKFYVGDSDQSLYRFRGGEPKQLVRLAESGAWNCHTLQLNYRSMPMICHAADLLITNNAGRVAKNIVPVRDEDDTSQILVGHYDTEGQQYMGLVAAVQADLERYPLAECAVLCRNNWQVSDAATTLRAAGIKVRERKRVDKPEDWGAARDVIGFLANPSNDYLAHRVMVFARGKETADKMRAEAVKGMTTVNEAFLHVGEPSLDDVPAALSRLGVRPPSVERVSLAISSLDPEDRTLAALSLALGDEALWSEEPMAEGVTVCTVHSAKGREWACVFLPWWNQQLFPGKKEGEDLEDQRRVAFVALTRAKDRVWISSCSKCRVYGTAREPVPMIPSQFIREAGL